jgi:hypothetical protein
VDGDPADLDVVTSLRGLGLRGERAPHGPQGVDPVDVIGTLGARVLAVAEAVVSEAGGVREEVIDKGG